ncbi:hypothetical protein [Corallococcus macrosporus]|uniref:Lipoprotein n=2 Tax=Myxococcaceae TaxID=31 RepID=A0A250K4P9_9BACT|nr:hypothetical protein [Corallococcus macrosporus]ATB50880.1 hypothetical protein MYMAC_006537 [Corallococcus macrosporus DSM 14697]
MKRTLCSALLGLSLAACGPMDEAAPDLTSEQEQPLEATCTSVDNTAMTTHACAHASNPGDNVNVNGTSGAPNISTQHKHYTVALSGSGTGTVTYIPVARTSTTSAVESVAFYTTQNVTITAVDTSVTPNVTLTALVSTDGITEGTCALHHARVFDLQVGHTYELNIATSPATTSVGVVPEYLYDNRGRYYRDADGDGYGASSPLYRFACEAPAGYVTQRFDCDDTNPAIFNC